MSAGSAGLGVHCSYTFDAHSLAVTQRSQLGTFSATAEGPLSDHTAKSGRSGTSDADL